jgi:hypothetical protein
MDITRYHYALNELPLCLENHPSHDEAQLVPQHMENPHENQPSGIRPES